MNESAATGSQLDSAQKFQHYKHLTPNGVNPFLLSYSRSPVIRRATCFAGLKPHKPRTVLGEDLILRLLGNVGPLSHPFNGVGKLAVGMRVV